jgi:hypothetical protein
LIAGFEGSFSHSQNGMTRADMLATKLVAQRLDEVIIFRSTGPWAKRWLEKGYPSKNFHVKGKSSDWGPHAGLVSYDGIYSKVGANPAKAADGTHKNDEGLASGFAAREVLELTMSQIEQQISVPEGSPSRTACLSKFPIPDSKDFLITANRSGDQKTVIFRAFDIGGRYRIHVYPPTDGANKMATNPFMVANSDPRGERSVPLYVMTSREVDAQMPMTGDYDLFAVCPKWANYGSQSGREISKPGINLEGRGVQQGLTFAQGVGMDNVLDPRLSTMGSGARTMDFLARKEKLQEKMLAGKVASPGQRQAYLDGGAYQEHADMGNLTPRILRCINELNGQMGATGTKAGFRRVHHNAESHRFRKFGALTEKDMLTRKDGDEYTDGFPLTSFHPSGLMASHYGEVCTLESLHEFRTYAAWLNERGFYVPKNWIWLS